MKVIRVDKPMFCGECGSYKKLRMCSVRDELGDHVMFFCNDCLNKFELDEKNYRLLE